jgi:hypothetical protein
MYYFCLCELKACVFGQPFFFKCKLEIVVSVCDSTPSVVALGGRVLHLSYGFHSDTEGKGKDKVLPRTGDEGSEEE